MLKGTVLALMVSQVVGCATIDYVGESYAPTPHVDLFFSLDDVPRDYRIIGEVRASGDQFVSASGLQQKLMERAQASGADAVIVLEVGRRLLLDQKEYTETTTESKDENGATVKKTAIVSNPSAEGSIIRALFVRYR